MIMRPVDCIHFVVGGHQFYAAVPASSRPAAQPHQRHACLQLHFLCLQPLTSSPSPPPLNIHQVVCAGSKDSFQIFVWSLKTGRLLDVLAAHEGPVIALGFCPGAGLLASGSWDR